MKSFALSTVVIVVVVLILLMILSVISMMVTSRDDDRYMRTQGKRFEHMLMPHAWVQYDTDQGIITGAHYCITGPDMEPYIEDGAWWQCYIDTAEDYSIGKDWETFESQKFDRRYSASYF